MFPLVREEQFQSATVNIEAYLLAGPVPECQSRRGFDEPEFYSDIER
jgi:hypothetical protein